MSDHLAACVRVIEELLQTPGLVFEHEGIADQLEAAGLIYWTKVRSDGEVDANFEGSEDLEPGDTYWVTTKKWQEIVTAAGSTK